MEANGDSSGSSALSHIPVLLHEVTEALRCREGGRFVDCTLGHGGLAYQILTMAGPGGFLIGIDQDDEAIAVARARLQRFQDRIHLVLGNFRKLKQYLDGLGVSEVDGVVFDLGVSSAQLNHPERGFSFMVEGPLDMRMDRRAALTAADILQQRSESELADIIFHYGEERYARRIARAIVQARARQSLRTTLDLVSIIRGAVPAVYRHGRIHYATRTFQALRIAVNDELDALASSFRDAIDVLTPGGRLCIISFHSLEDRIAKHTLRELSGREQGRVKVLTKRPLISSETERRNNPRARSAKLRVAERLPVRAA
ncbi:MAG TPA: 16S rRNA (cytosine(1402)-N(4))-methyltransferase RsmH [Nitrospiraceae bacterium]|nr:16S rRNA (cytosine(1402)-N(4))-methyltransferase RsmH [Nitrospiraceae bacterium]